MYIRDSYFGKVAPYAGLDVVKVLTGMRRSGKSVLLGQIRDVSGERGRRGDRLGEFRGG